METVISKDPSAAKSAVEAAKRRRDVSRRLIGVSGRRGSTKRIVSSGRERARELARPARDRHLHDVGQVRQLRYVPDDRRFSEGAGEERLYIRVRERRVRSQRDADDRGGSQGVRQLDQKGRAAAVLLFRGRAGGTARVRSGPA